jgi:hypothetical protein
VVGRYDRGRPRVHQHETSRAVRVFHHARTGAALAEQRRLLVAGCAGDGNRDRKCRSMGLAVNLTGGVDLRENQPGNLQYLQELVIPVARMDVKKHRPGGVGTVGDMPGAAGEVPDQPGVDRPEGKPPLLRHPAGVRQMIEDPGDLGPGEVGVRDKARPLPDERFQPLCFQAVAGGRGAAVLPDDGVMDRPARGALPDHRRFPLVGDADGGDVGGAQARILQGQGRNTGLGFPYLAGIVLHPAGPGIVLAELLLRRGNNQARVIEDNRPGTGRTLIEGYEKGHRNLLEKSRPAAAAIATFGRAHFGKNHTVVGRACRRDFFRVEFSAKKLPNRSKQGMDAAE